MGEMTQLDGVTGYLARPEGSGPWPGLVVIQEWWGLDAQTKSIADRFAKAGYLSFAPDLYHGEQAKLHDDDKAKELSQKYGPKAPEELQKAFDALKDDDDCTGKVGSVGFCFGGKMNLALGLRRPLDALCMFYGGGMQQLFGQMDNLHNPVLGLFGDQDRSIPAGTVEEFQELLAKIGVPHEVVVYPGAGHAFFRDSDPTTYRPEAAKDAWDRVSNFFTENLKQTL